MEKMKTADQAGRLKLFVLALALALAFFAMLSASKMAQASCEDCPAVVLYAP